MSISSHNIYDNVRTRVIVLHGGCVLLIPPGGDAQTWRLPGGGLCPDENLTDCGIREVLEETGIRVRALGVAFLREWVVPKYCPPEIDGQQGFGLEIFMYAHPLDPTTPLRPERAGLPTPSWVPLSEISGLPLWPKELKALAVALKAERVPAAVPTFVAQLESPWELPNETLAFNVPPL
jgi:phosphatase NudJ